MDPDVDRALHSRPLRIGVNVVGIPAVVLSDGYYVMNHRSDGKEAFTGFSIDLIDIVAEALNFSYELVRSPDGEWGDEHSGQWTGLVGLLQRKEIDMAFMLSPSVERSKVVQWSVPVEYGYNNIAVRTVDVQPDLWTAFFSPFHWSVYICILVSFLLSMFLLYLVMRLEGDLWPGRDQVWSLGEVGRFLYSSLLSRGIPWTWNGITGRTVIAGWCFLGFMLTSAYTSKLTSLLVGVTPSPPFTSVREMLARDDYRWGIAGGSKPVQILRDSKNVLEQEIYRRMMEFANDDPDILSRDFTVHLTKVLTEHYAYIGDSPIIEIWAAKHCDITMLPIKLTGLEYYSITLPKDSIIIDAVNDVLLRLHDTGSLTFPRRRRFQSATSCHGKQSPEQTFSLTALQGPFYVAAAGLLLAAGIMCVERWAHFRGIPHRASVL